MKRKGNVGLSFLLILCLCVSMVAGVSLPVSAAAIWTDRSVQQQIFTNTALAYFYKGDAMQYGSYYIASGYRYAGGITRGTPNRSPEDATSEDKLYNVCSAYPHDIYFEAFGEHILTDEMAIPATSQIHSVNFETDSVNSDFLTSVQNSTENYCYHGAMAKAAGFDVDTVDVDARENAADADNVYADVLYYFGPDLDVETGEPITYATRKADCSGGNLYTISSGVATLAKTTGGFYPGGDRGLLQPGAVAYSQFCVLRPLNSSRFNTGAWQEGSNTTNAQTYDEKLYSGTVSADALVVDAIPVHSEFLYGRRYYPADTKVVIGDETYTSLSAAITAAKAGDTITLVADIYTEEESGTKVGSSIPKYPLQTDFDLTLDLNGHTIDDTGDTVHAKYVIPGYTWSEADGFYYATTTGIAAKCLGDTIYFAVYYRLRDGSYGYSGLAGYSPKTYAYNQLRTGSAEMKPLVVAMLKYGAAAQSYFNYNTENPINAALTEEQNALVEAYRSDMMGKVVQASGDKLGAFINDKTYLGRYPTISFEGAFCINYYFQPSLAVEGDVTMYIWSLEDYEAAGVLTKENATKTVTMTLTETGEYLGVVDGIAAKDLDKAAYVSFVYNDGTADHCGGVIAYTIGLYCKSQASKTGTLAELAKACAVYGYYAKQLFNK